MHCTRTKLFNIHVCKGGTKFPKGGPNFLGNMAPRGPYFLGNLARGDHILGGAKFPGTPVPQDNTSFAITYTPLWNMLNLFMFSLRIKHKYLQHIEESGSNL